MGLDNFVYALTEYALIMLYKNILYYTYEDLTRFVPLIDDRYEHLKVMLEHGFPEEYCRTYIINANNAIKNPVKRRVPNMLYVNMFRSYYSK